MADKKTILVVDDDRFNVALIRELCESVGFSVIEAHDGQEALEQVRTTLPDLMLLDIMMGVKDGFEVCRELRARPETADLPIIIVTAMDTLDSKIQGLDMGADDYVTKPFRLFELQQRIHNVMEIHRYRRQLREAEEKLRRLGGIDTPGRVGGFRQLGPGLDYEFNRAVRYEHPLACVLFSVDRYDAVLEMRGQKAAGAMIGAVVAVLKKTLRSVDRIYRTDKEQFILLLPETSTAGARVALDRIRRTLRTPQKPRSPSVTISAALMVYPDPRVETGHDLLRILEQLHQAYCLGKEDCQVGPEEPSQEKAGTRLEAPDR